MSVKFLKCEAIDEMLKRRQPEGMILPEAKAKELHAQGIVRILQDEIPEKPQDKKEIDLCNYLRRDRFSNSKVKTKIAYIQDMSKLGGAELSNQVVVSAGEQCGFDIVGITPKMFKQDVMKQADALIINNYFEFEKKQIEFINDLIYEKRKPYIKYEHDYRELSRRQISVPLFRHSILNVFISPDHLETHCKSIDGCLKEKSIALPLAVNHSKFKSDDKNRRKDTVIVPAWRKCKSNLKKFIEENKNLKFTIIGKHDIGATKANQINIQPYEKINQVFKTFQYLYHCPDRNWAGERIVLEGVLSGCELFVNNNVGHCSWEYLHNEIELRKQLEIAPFNFWRKIDKCLKCIFQR